jgi:hypothetical protein
MSDFGPSASAVVDSLVSLKGSRTNDGGAQIET